MPGRSTAQSPVLIIGGSLFGSALAWAFARMGRTVELWEQAPAAEALHLPPLLVAKGPSARAHDRVSNFQREALSRLQILLHEAEKDFGPHFYSAQTPAGEAVCVVETRSWIRYLQRGLDIRWGTFATSESLLNLGSATEVWFCVGAMSSTWSHFKQLPLGINAGMLLTGTTRDSVNGISFLNSAQAKARSLTLARFGNMLQFGSTFERRAGSTASETWMIHRGGLEADAMTYGLPPLMCPPGLVPWSGFRASFPDARPVADQGVFTGGGSKSLLWSIWLAESIVQKTTASLFSTARFHTS